MDGSGLKQEFTTFYAENSVDKALNSHSFARALKGHYLIVTSLISSLMNIVLKSASLLESEKLDVKECLDAVGTDKFLKVFDNDLFNVISLKVKKRLQELQTNGRQLHCGCNTLK